MLLSNRLRRYGAGLLFCAIAVCGVHADEVYLDPNVFLQNAFDGAPPASKRLWLTKELKASVREILGHQLGQLRVRYWRRDARTVWILEEIGKDQPITTGFTIDDGRLSEVRVLIYRESRGWEVRYPAFTDQFVGADIDEQLRLNRHIDGITGATLSVSALTRLARLSLLLDNHAKS